MYLTPKVGLTEIVKHILIDLRIVVYNGSVESSGVLWGHKD